MQMLILVLTIKVLITIVTIVVNLLVILAIMLAKRFQKPKHYLIFSLSVADFLVGIYTNPYNILLETKLDTWLFNTTNCLILLPLSVSIFCVVASIFGLVLISLDRYVAVCYPFFYKVHATRRKVFVIIGLTWLLSAICSTPVWVFTGGHHAATAHLKHPSCIAIKLSWIRIVHLAILYFTPAFLIIILNLRIWWVIWSRSPGNRCIDVSRLPFVAYVHCKTSEKCTGFKLLKKQKGATMLGVMVGLFLVCWIPLFSFLLTIQAYEFGEFPFKLHEAFKWLGFSNSCVNPFVYTMFSAEFRRAVSAIALCKCRSVNSRLRVSQVAKQIYNNVTKYNTNYSP